MGRPTAAVSSDFDVFVCSECSPERLHRRGNLKFTSPNCVEVGSATEIGERLRAAWEKYVFAEAVNDTPHAAKSSSRLGLRRRRSDKMMKRRGSPRGFRCVAQMMVEDQHPKASGEGGRNCCSPSASHRIHQSKFDVGSLYQASWQESMCATASC